MAPNRAARAAPMKSTGTRLYHDQSFLIVPFTYASSSNVCQGLGEDEEKGNAKRLIKSAREKDAGGRQGKDEPKSVWEARGKD